MVRKLIRRRWLLTGLLTSILVNVSLAQEESDYYRIVDLIAPIETKLEVGGIAILEDGRPIVCTRRGDIFIVENAYDEKGTPNFKLYADGLHEPLGLLLHGGWLYAAQRGELTRMRDTDGDDKADVFETFCDDWEISGDYHEYAFGPRLDKDGNFWVTLNRPFGNEHFGRVHWRGWAMKITPEGVMTPQAAGLRSPAGVEISPWGGVFFTDNQGEWVGTNKLSEIKFGDFHGSIHSLHSKDEPGSMLNGFRQPASGKYHYVAADEIPELKNPAVWFPYDKMGKSASGMVWDTTGGKFGPFKDQLFVADQHHSWVMRVFLEKVGDRYQGACFRFREGFQSGTLRLAWGKDSSMFVGMTNRGWGSRGNRTDGLQRCVWTGKVPFEFHEMRAKPDGFELTFTLPVDPKTAGDPASYTMESYTYRLHNNYGSPEVDGKKLEIKSARVSADGKSVYLKVDGLRWGYVHELIARGVRSSKNLPLLHPEAYYTLNLIPKK